MKPWIVITITGTTAGAFVGALTYTATAHTSDLVAAGTGLGIHALGTAGSYLASALIGDMAGVSVRVASQIAGNITQEAIKTNGRTAAALIGATSGALTAFTFTAGSHIIKYTIEYGGLITEQLAKKIAEEYIRFQTDQTGFENASDTGWVVIDTESEQTAEGASEQTIEQTIQDDSEQTKQTTQDKSEQSIQPSIITPQIIENIQEH